MRKKIVLGGWTVRLPDGIKEITDVLDWTFPAAGGHATRLIAKDKAGTAAFVFSPELREAISFADSLVRRGKIAGYTHADRGLAAQRLPPHWLRCTRAQIEQRNAVLIQRLVVCQQTPILPTTSFGDIGLADPVRLLQSLRIIQMHWPACSLQPLRGSAVLTMADLNNAVILALREQGMTVVD